MPEGDEVAVICERHDTLGVVLGDGEEGLEDSRNALPKLGAEPVHDEMGVLLRHGRVGRRDVVPQGDVVQGHAQRRAVWQVRHNHGVRHTTVLMHQHEIRHALRQACLHEILHDRVSAIQAHRVREDEAHLLGELRQPAAGVARGRDDDLGVVRADLGVLVVDVGFGVGLSLVENKVLADGTRLVAKLSGEGAAGGESVLDALLALEDRALSRLVRLLEEVLAALACLTAKLGLDGYERLSRCELLTMMDM